MLEGFPPGLRDRFEPRRVLGKGAMGTVYLATRLSDGGEVAVKVVRERGSATLRDRFLREAKSQARLEHPHVLRIFDWGEDAGDPFLVMEVLEGRSLELGPVDYDPLAVMLEIAEGLEAVHGAGLVHRDLKPANVFLCRDGRAVLTDFGLVRDPDLTALTATGQVVGSLGYLPPEVLLGERPGPLADWYAWGVCLYRLREGRLPFAAEQLVAVAQGGDLPEVEFEELDPQGPEAAMIRRQLGADKAGRCAGRGAIEACLRGPPRRAVSSSSIEEPRPARRPRAAGWVAMVAVAGIAGGWLAGRGAPDAGSGRPPPEPTSPLGKGLGLAVREQLSDAGERMIDDAGVVHELPDGPIPSSWRHLVNGDPHHYRALVEQMPSLARWYDFLGQGGAPEELPPSQQEELREADERFRVVGYPGPFGPVLRGPGQPRSSEGESRSLPGTGVPWPPEIGPWFARVLQAYDAAIAERRSLEAALPRLLEDPPRMLNDQTRIQLELFLAAKNPLSSTLRELGRAPGSRPFVGNWTKKGTEHLLALLHAAGRALREEPETALEVALIAHMALAHHDVFRHSVIAWLPRRSLLGPDGDGLAWDFLDLGLRRVQLSGRGPLSPDRVEEVAALLVGTRDVLARAGEDPDPATRALVDAALGDISSWAAKEGGREDVWLDDLHPFLETLARNPRAYPRAWRHVIDLWHRKPELFRKRPGLAQGLVPVLESLRVHRKGERRARLEACLEELRDLGI